MGRFGGRIEAGWRDHGEPASFAYTLPSTCNLCQLATVFVRPGHNTACTLTHEGRNYLFCSKPCRWIFEQERARFAEHKTIIDRVLDGEASSDTLDLHH